MRTHKRNRDKTRPVFKTSSFGAKGKIVLRLCRSREEDFRSEDSHEKNCLSETALFVSLPPLPNEDSLYRRLPDHARLLRRRHTLLPAWIYLGREAPIVKTRIRQYENTSIGDFRIDRHPGMENVCVVGGGSSHGFKLGPALGEYVAGRSLDDTPAEPRFSLATKPTVQQRGVY